MAKTCLYNDPVEMRLATPDTVAMPVMTLHATDDSNMHPKWEYMTLKLPTEFRFLSGTDFDTSELAGQLNAYGEQGWELVSIFDIEKVKGGSKYVVAVMKRQKG